MPKKSCILSASLRKKFSQEILFLYGIIAPCTVESKNVLVFCDKFFSHLVNSEEK